MFNKNNYNTDIQIGAMKRFYPQFKVIKRGHFDIEFVGTLSVKPVFPVYTVSINYRGNLRPLVRILKPALVEDPPHFHKENISLCLYHSRYYHWTKEKLIAKDIVSWTAAWIYFYEKWLQTGKWYGPEVPHVEDLIKAESN
jgi:hypothetical protein